MKIMGMDIGEKRIGIAITDAEKKLSIPHSVISNNKKFQDKLGTILDGEEIEKIIVGMPYTLKGEIGRQGKRVLDFVKENILGMGMEVEYQDERFTSKFPAEVPIKKDKLKKNKDKFSAALILQAYLERKIKMDRTKDE